MNDDRAGANDIFQLLLRNASMLNSARSPDDVYRVLADNMADVAGSPCAVFILDGNILRWKVSSKDGAIMADETISPSGSIAEAVGTKSCVRTDAISSGLPPQMVRKYSMASILFVPVTSNGSVTALAIIYSGSTLDITTEKQEAMSIMAYQAARALGCLILFHRFNRCNNELDRVYYIQYRMTKSIDLDEAIVSIVENAPSITRLQYCMVYLLDQNVRNIVSVKAPEAVEKKFGKLRFNMDELVASKIAVLERRPLFIEDARNYTNISQRIVKMLDFRSAIVMPLIAREQVLGVMWLYSTDYEVRFDDNDRRSAIALANQAATIIYNARVFRELEESYEKLKDLDRNKMEFFTLISHELRNPLAVIKGFTEIIYDGTLGPLNTDQKDKLQKIRESVDRLTDIIGNMADISSFESRQYPVNKMPTSIQDIVNELVETMSFLFNNKHIRVVVDVPMGLSLAEVDPKRLEQVLLNLLNNALKYTPEGGQVTVTARDRDSDILVYVHDTGIGIPKKDLDQIFSGFYHSGYKLSYEYKGPGLGLAISRKIIESHGGRIWADSEVGKGSTFYFTIPKHQKPIGSTGTEAVNAR